MQDPKEKFFEVDKDDNPIGAISREKANSDPTRFHRAINLLIEFDGTYLITKRPHDKDTFPDCFDLSVTGHVNYPEEYIHALLRETEEEIGLDLDTSKVKELGKMLVKMENENEYQMNYVVSIDREHYKQVKAIEAAEIFWMTKDEILDSLKSEPTKWTDWAREAVVKLYLINQNKHE